MGETLAFQVTLMDLSSMSVEAVDNVEVEPKPKNADL